MKPLYIAATLIGIWGAGSFLLATIPTLSIFWGEVHSAAVDVSRTFFAVGCLLSLANFVHSYHVASDETARRKLRWLLLGTTIGPLPFILFWQAPMVMQMPPLLSEELAIIITAVTPITFAIAIVRHQLMDIDLILNRSTVYAIVLGALLIVYMLMITAASAIVGTLVEAHR